MVLVRVMAAVQDKMVVQAAVALIKVELVELQLLDKVITEATGVVLLLLPTELVVVVVLVQQVETELILLLVLAVMVLLHILPGVQRQEQVKMFQELIIMQVVALVLVTA